MQCLINVTEAHGSVPRTTKNKNKQKKPKAQNQNIKQAKSYKGPKSTNLLTLALNADAESV
jgi:hypothetical protein